MGMPLHERVRPTQWADVKGQDKAVGILKRLGADGIGGRALWITGQSGTGKTTIAKLASAEIADALCSEEIDAGELTVSRVKDIERESQYRGLGVKSGRAYIVNESHGLRKDTVRQLLVTLERVPSHVVWIFTTTNDGQAALFEGNEDANPLLSRCMMISLSRQGISAPFAERLADVDPTGPRPKAEYVKLLQKHKNNLRAALQEIERDALEVELSGSVEPSSLEVAE
jgi:DNA polymerase-3 subunit gamma/tau